jgi:WD40-like Beta Propeller Repeat
MALLWSRIVAAVGAGQMDSPNAVLSGTFVVCKEYGTVLGTYLTDVRGKDISRLNYLFGEDVNPRFSPTDDRVLFASAKGGTPGVWTMNRKGEEQERICDGDQGDWFPDGRRIAFRRQGRIVERSIGSGQETFLSPADWKSCSWPACSPDGRQILFVTNDGGKEALCVTATGESQPRRITEGEILSAPRWAPGGEQIVYQGGAHLWTIDADGGNQRQLTVTGGIQRRPVWSPDGTAIAYCQGPNPKGPWQMAVIRCDGTRRLSIPPGDARSVLCSDWGVKRPDQKPAPTGEAVRPPPRLRLWETGQSVTAASPDWAAFCRERSGWNETPVEKVPSEALRGGCAMENDSAVFVLLPGKPGVLIPKPALRTAIEFTLLDPQGRQAGPVESIRVLSHTPDEAVLESSAHSAGVVVKATWTIGGSRALVHVTPVENVDKLRIEVPMQCVVVPDRFGNDIVADPEAFGEGRTVLPWGPLVTGFCGNGSDLLVLVCPEPSQRTELRKGTGASFASADVAFGNHGLSAGVVTREGACHLEHFRTGGSADPLRFQWRMPCAASWRLTLQGDGQRFSTLFSDKESAFFDEKAVLFRKNKDFAAGAQLWLIYLSGRTASTPLDVLTPVDLARDVLGLQAAARTLDDEGVTSYRKAAGPTLWAELSVTIDSLRYLFERQLEVQDSVYARHLIDDLPLFAEGMDQRLKEYTDFAREIQGLSTTLDTSNPSAAKLAANLAADAEKLGDLGKQQLSLKSSQELLPLCAKITQLTATDAGQNRNRFEQYRKELLRVVGPREEMLRDYRKLAIDVRDAAGNVLLTQAELVGPVEKIRSLCQSVLRNRLYTEADWRGEDYTVPAFWLGPRPYE